MNTHAEKTQENKSRAVANTLPGTPGRNASTFQFIDNRPEVAAQVKLQEMADDYSEKAHRQTLQHVRSGQGKETGQGIAYLDDGTMIVVEGGDGYIGNNIQVAVTSILQTVAGRLVFAKPAKDV